MTISRPWDGTHARYAELREFAGVGPDGRPGFYAPGMMSIASPGPGRVWYAATGQWLEVPLGWPLLRGVAGVTPSPVRGRPDVSAA